jgi:hypothetical protein
MLASPGNARLAWFALENPAALLEEILIAGSDCVETVAKLPATLRLRPTLRLSVESPSKSSSD